MAFNEADTIAKLVNPVLYAAGWTENAIRREVQLTEAAYQLQVHTRRVGRIDIGLFAVIPPEKRERMFAIVEVKAETHKPDRGLTQAKAYGSALQIPFVYATNGHYFVEYCFIDGNRSRIQDMSHFPSPTKLIERYQSYLYEVAVAAATNFEKTKVSPSIPSQRSVTSPGSTRRWTLPPVYPVASARHQSNKADQSWRNTVQSTSQTQSVSITPLVAQQAENTSRRPNFSGQSRYVTEEQSRLSAIARILGLFLLIALFIAAWPLARSTILNISESVGQSLSDLQMQPVGVPAPLPTLSIEATSFPSEDAEAPTQESISLLGPTMYVSSNGQRINARVCASTDCSVRMVFQSGDSVQIYGLIAGESWRGSTAWYEVMVEGDLAYIHSSLLSANPPLMGGFAQPVFYALM